MNPLEQYKHTVNSGHWIADPMQLAVMEHLQAIYEGMQKQGLYIWGSVGIGKTDLMDIFYQSLPEASKKLRLHFHRFMREVHRELTRLQGQKNPLKIIAENFSKQAKIICFDEFVVTDITDAMLLGELFKYLFEKNIILIATSNTAPDGLY
ncbi:MAG: cell division protein ZapE, partial [Gammaproteobacteria bacterium]